jgi:1-deoxy-D-xylulose-5-phosphate synthase
VDLDHPEPSRQRPPRGDLECGHDPVDPGFVQGGGDRVAVVEDGSVVGGVGSQIAYAVRAGGLDLPVDTFGLPREFLDHGSRGQVLDLVGLTPDVVAGSLRERLR